MNSARLVLLLGAVLLSTAALAGRPQVLRGKLLDESGKPLAGEPRPPAGTASEVLAYEVIQHEEAPR